MTGRIPVRLAGLAVATLAITIVLAIAAASATITYVPMYSNIPSTLSGDVPSLGFQERSVSEVGGQVGLVGTSANNTKVTVGLSSWACQQGVWNVSSGPEKCVHSTTETFAWPVILRIYLANPDGSVGPKIAQLRQTVAMPYRPTASEKCTGANAGGWSWPHCYSGKLFKVTFQLRGIYLPSHAIISVAYSTSGFGPEPQGYQPCSSTTQGCFYDHLKVALEDPNNPAFSGSPFTGTQPRPADTYAAENPPGAFCAKTAGSEPTGNFQLETGCEPNWAGRQPLISVSTGG